MVKGKKLHSLFKVFNPSEKRKLYKLSSRGAFIAGEDDVIRRYKKSRVQKTHLVSAPWSLVIVFALVNAVAVNAVRVVWIHFFGKPQIWSSDALEKRYELELKQSPTKYSTEKLRQLIAEGK